MNERDIEMLDFKVKMHQFNFTFYSYDRPPSWK